MKVKVVNHLLEYRNNKDEAEKLFQTIEELLKEASMVLESFTVDGIEVYEEPYQYILENLEQINSIEVTAKSFSDLLIDTLLEMQKYISRALPEIKNLAEEYYVGIQQSSWERFEQLLEGIQWILSVLEAVESENLYHNTSEFRSIKIQIAEQIQELQGAVEQEDRTLIADLLLYEIVVIFERLSQEVLSTLSYEKNTKNLN